MGVNDRPLSAYTAHDPHSSMGAVAEREYDVPLEQDIEVTPTKAIGPAEGLSKFIFAGVCLYNTDDGAFLTTPLKRLDDARYIAQTVRDLLHIGVPQVGFDKVPNSDIYISDWKSGIGQTLYVSREVVQQLEAKGVQIKYEAPKVPAPGANLHQAATYEHN